ncbi:YpmS family protein [Bacillus tuaregi]|uniref:YpmS family protein n=1 Tax=Bacillus tuaregi TaxID=1816695 RepID=UPI0008F86E9B|nr:YpmS family protein [Bacillus tuaregi]
MKAGNWKRWFYILLGINATIIVVLIVLFILLFSSTAEPVEIPKSTEEQNDVYFQVKTNREDLNKVINHYLEEELSGQFDYQLILTDEVELYGTLPVFSSEVEMKLTFEPHALENGDIELEQKTMSIGRLLLPVPLVLKFVQSSYEVPEWVMIQPNEERIYMSLQNMKLKSGFEVKVDKFDLKKDDISFSLRIPMNESMKE